MKQIDFITKLHKSTKRNYLERANNNKLHCIKEAKKFGYNYWDGNRKYGYGGYHYDGRWENVAKKIINYYKINSKSKILDIGCGKAFLLYEIFKLSGCKVKGLDISKYGIKNGKKEIRKFLKVGDCTKLPYKDKEFDLVFSLNVFHNLEISQLERAIKEMNRVARNKKYIVVESYTNLSQKNNLLNWQLTCESFYSKKQWLWLFKKYNYKGDYNFIYFD